MKIYLASKSPRRKELLAQMNVEFDVLALDTPEEVLDGESPYQYSKRVTQEKLFAAWQKIIIAKMVSRPILCADTEVIIDDTILGKPLDYQDAFNMLKRYSGKSHTVITTVGIKYFDYEELATQTTTVSFAKMSDQDIHTYLITGNYKDKAGAYGIQSYIGQFISHIDGCFFSVMGLPLNIVRKLLQNIKQQVV